MLLIELAYDCRAVLDCCSPYRDHGKNSNKSQTGGMNKRRVDYVADVVVELSAEKVGEFYYRLEKDCVRRYGEQSSDNISLLEILDIEHNWER